MVMDNSKDNVVVDDNEEEKEDEGVIISSMHMHSLWTQWCYISDCPLISFPPICLMWPKTRMNALGLYTHEADGCYNG